MGPGSWSEPQKPLGLLGASPASRPSNGTPWATVLIILGLAAGVALYAYAPKTQRKGTSLVAPEPTSEAAPSRPRGPAAPTSPSPAAGSSRFPGSVPRAALEAALAKAAPAIQGCWATGLARDPTVGRSVTMELRVLDDGLVESAERSSGSLTEAGTLRCLGDALALLELPKPTGGAAIVRVSLAYAEPGDAGPDADDDAPSAPSIRRKRP